MRKSGKSKNERKAPNTKRPISREAPSSNPGSHLPALLVFGISLELGRLVFGAYHRFAS
jgi:hypothetical protein